MCADPESKTAFEQSHDIDSGIASLDITLRDGRAVHLRATRRGDEEELLQGFERLSHDARYMRFMHVVREPNLERVRSAIASFPERGIGLVATVPADDGIDIVGTAVAVFAKDKRSCEFAITIASAFGGVGLATQLMTALIDGATRRGIRDMEGFVLAQNQPMLRLARRLGFTVAYEPGDASVRVCRLTLGNSQDAPVASP